MRRDLIQALSDLQMAGLSHLPTPSASPPSTLAEPAPAGGTASPAFVPSGSSHPPRGSSHPDSNRAEEALKRKPPSTPLLPAGVPAASTAATLEVLRQEVAGCQLCSELAATRTQTVFGVGAPRAKLCFLGEAPGADEDRTGEPFVGRGGQLLNKMLEACRLKRQDIYILNILKCRPPGNRNPTPTEAANCRPFLERQIELIGPEYLCCLGAVAAQNLLQTTSPIGRLRGSVHDWRGIKVVCTYHPAYLLRNPAAKADAWEDLKLLMRTFGAPVD